MSSVHADQNMRALLTWQMRFDIIMGIAWGLLYLHHDSRLKITQRDLKASNILLDDKSNAKISEFGLDYSISKDKKSRWDIVSSISFRKYIHFLLNEARCSGYIAPEYAFHGKSGVFSLGVVIL